MTEKRIGMEIISTANALRRVTFQESYGEAIEENTPTSMQKWFLGYIWEHYTYGDVFQKDLEAAFNVRRSTATEILKAMERKKLIERIPSAEDKRSKKILLTEAASVICEENEKKIAVTERKISNGLSAQEINDLFMILRKIQKNIDTI